VPVIALLAAGPAVAVAVSGGHEFALALTAASLIAGAGAGYAADDPAAPTLASSPTPLAVRRLHRAAVIVTVLAAGWLIALYLAGRYSRERPDIDAMTVELAATAALSAAFACRVHTDTPVETGFGAAGAAILSMLTMSALSNRWPELPSLAAGPTHDRWWWVTAAGVSVAAWSSRDPARRRPH
jgi:hypothetical protein